MREFHNVARTGKTRVWKIEVVGDQVITEYGDLGGKMQRVTDTAQSKNAGKANYVSPAESAIKQAERQILLKSREGYIEIGQEPREESVNWSTTSPLPGNLCFYKPDNTLSVALEKKLEAGAAWLSRKRDGEMMVVCCGEDGKVTIYSRRMLLGHDKETTTWWNDRFPHLVDAFESVLPPKSIVLGELVANEQEDNRWHVASVMKSLTPRAIELQEKGGPLHYYVWDIAFWEGEDLVSNVPVGERYRKIEDVFEGQALLHPVAYYETSEILEAFDLASCMEASTYDPFKSHIWNAACALAVEAGWEGFVVVDPAGIYGDKAYNFRGKADRPGKYSGKLKPEYECDALALFNPEGGDGKWGRGKYQGMVGSVALFQYSAEGKLVYLCDCGGGIDDTFREKYSDPEVYPIVLKVRYTNRTYISMGDDTNAMQFPRIVGVREDKNPDECIEERL